MNCEEIKRKINIRIILESFNIFPVKENGKTAFYFAVDRSETVPSLSVDYIKNKAFDFGTGRSFDVISIVQLIKKCSVSDALRYLQSFTGIEECILLLNEPEKGKNYKILNVGEIRHPALIQYLNSRKILPKNEFIKEIHYEINSKRYFGVGFFNDSGGLEIRNKYSKICLGNKDITLITNDQKHYQDVVVFEGFFDFLTYMTINTLLQETSDFLILNSTAMLFKIENKLKDYNRISLFLDNDANGKRVKDMMRSKYSNIEDCSLLYLNHKDLNEWYCQHF